MDTMGLGFDFASSLSPMLGFAQLKPAYGRLLLLLAS
jgi:hypothetical protein